MAVYTGGVDGQFNYLQVKEKKKNELTLSQLFNYNMKMQLIFFSYNSSHFSHQQQTLTMTETLFLSHSRTEQLRE